MQVKLMYFARLREALATDGEVVELAAGMDIAALKQHLAARGGVWLAELGGARLVRAAINQELAQEGSLIPAGAEVALFPPVTGG